MHNQRRNKQQETKLIPIVQVCQTAFTMAQTWHAQAYQPEIMFIWLKPLVNAEKEHLVMSKSGPLTAARNFMGEFDVVRSTQKNAKQRKGTLQNEEDQQWNERQQLHTFKRKQQHKTTYPKKKQKPGHDANTNCTIVSHNINHDTNIPTCSTSNIQWLETPVDTETEDSLSSNEEAEVQVQTQTNTRR